jgi:hypothetical protein
MATIDQLEAAKRAAIALGVALTQANCNVTQFGTSPVWAAFTAMTSALAGVTDYLPNAGPYVIAKTYPIELIKASGLSLTSGAGPKFAAGLYGPSNVPCIQLLPGQDVVATGVQLTSVSCQINGSVQAQTKATITVADNTVTMINFQT